MRSSDQPLGFVTTVRAIVSSTPFFTLACLTAAIVLLMAQPVPEMDDGRRQAGKGEEWGGGDDGSQDRKSVV